MSTPMTFLGMANEAQIGIQHRLGAVPFEKASLRAPGVPFVLNVVGRGASRFDTVSRSVETWTWAPATGGVPTGWTAP